MKLTNEEKKKLKETSWQAFKKQAYKILRAEFIKLLLKQLAGSVAAGGVQGAVIKYGGGYVYDKFVLPLLQRMLRSGLFKYDQRKGKIVFKAFTKAKKENDENTYDDIVDNA